MAVHEVMPIFPEMRKLIMGEATGNELFTMARQKGAKTIREDGIIKVMEGKTTIDELIRVSYGGGEE
jgi:general secretion pathway protein E